MSSPSTWLSGGSGSGVYDPVTTTDGFPQTGGEVRFDTWTGKGRVYSFGTYRKSGLTGVCDKIRNQSSPKCLVIMFLSTVALLLICLIIVIARSHVTTQVSSDTNTNRWKLSKAGLHFLPIGIQNSDFFPFSPIDNTTYKDYVKILKSATDGYSTSLLRNHSHELCSKNHTPPNATCQQPVTDFGSSCTSALQFGYHGGQPCILLQFVLPNGYTMRGLQPKDGEPYVKAAGVLDGRHDPSSVGVSCEPVPGDRDKVKNIGDIEYNPATGFPDYLLWSAATADSAPPAVMVQFRSILGSVRDNRQVRFTCTAWGMMINDRGESVSPTGMFNVTFAFLIQ